MEHKPGAEIEAASKAIGNEQKESAKKNIRIYIWMGKFFFFTFCACTLIQFLVMLLSIFLKFNNISYRLLYVLLMCNSLVVTIFWYRNSKSFEANKGDLHNKIEGDSTYIEMLGSIWLDSSLPFFVWIVWLQMNIIFIIYQFKYW